jgi:heme A synthase
MNWSNWIRQGHRWLSMAFALIVAGLFAALAFGEPAEWVYFLPLPLLALLLLSGLYLFALPYAAEWRSGRRTGG